MSSVPGAGISAVLTLWILGFLGMLTARAGDFYVDRSSPGADDTNPGTRDRPLKTISAAATRARSGDTVWVGNGTYRETVWFLDHPFPFNGTTFSGFPSGSDMAHPTRLLACPGQKPIVKGSDLVNGWVQLEDHPNLWAKADWNINSQQVFCDGKILKQIGGTMAGSMMPDWKGRSGNGRDDMVPNSFYYDLARKILYVELDGVRDPNSCQMEVSTRPFLLYDAAQCTVVSGFTFLHGNTSAVVNWGAIQIKGSCNVLENSEISWCDFIGIQLEGRWNNVLGSAITHCGDTGISGAGQGNRVIDCEASSNNYRHWNGDWHAGGMKIIPFAKDMVISGCTAQGNIDSSGIWFDAGASNCMVENCKSFHNGGAGIMYEISERGVIENNVCYENKGWGIYISNSHDCLIAFNTCYGNGMSGIVVIGVERKDGPPFGEQATGVIPARNNTVWGNILMDNCNPHLCPRDANGGLSWSTRPELILPDPRLSYDEGCVSDYNIVYRSDGRGIPFWYNWGDEAFPNLEKWTLASGNDLHSRIADPLFVDTAAGDFHVEENSPANAVVLPLSNPRLDASGNERPSETLCSAGAYQAAFSTEAATKIRSKNGLKDSPPR